MGHELETAITLVHRGSDSEGPKLVISGTGGPRGVHLAHPIFEEDLEDFFNAQADFYGVHLIPLSTLIDSDPIKEVAEGQIIASRRNPHAARMFN